MNRIARDERVLRTVAQSIMSQIPGGTFVQTSPCGRGQFHPHGLLGRLWRIKNPETVRVGNCFLSGRLKCNDLFLCIKHSGDCFQTYMYVEEFGNSYAGRTGWTFDSYGIGDAEPVEITENEFATLYRGGVVLKTVTPTIEREWPTWTVFYNIVSTTTLFVGQGWEFFDNEDCATECYNRQLSKGNTPTKRPFHQATDMHHMNPCDISACKKHDSIKQSE